MTQNPWVIKTLVPEEVYTDREEFLEYFYNAALKAATRRTSSTVLLGQRRMGKTEIFKRVVNRLFFGQDPKSKNAVVPVYYSFPDEMVSRREFALNYIENFIRWYAAFHMGQPDILRYPEHRKELVKFIKKNIFVTKGFSGALGLFDAIERGGVSIPEQQALMLPRTVSDGDDSTIVMFLDEFQNAHLPQYKFRVVGFMQEAVESPTCPHFVTGSAMSILSGEIIGKGALYGRFRSRSIESFSDYFGAELVVKAADYYGAEIPEIMAPVISSRCGGNPFYITALIQQAVEMDEPVKDEETLNKILAVDLSSGFIWGELSDQVNRWIERLNGYGITKWILYLAALEETDEISLERIRKELKKHEGIEIDIPKIKEVLIKLSRGDLLDYKEFGDWFGKINDPVLNEFLKVWGRTEVERQNPKMVAEETIRQFMTMKKRFYEYKGYLAEVFMIQLLWNSQRKKLPGKYFHSPEDIKIPRRFIYIDQRHRPGTGIKRETDIYASSGDEIWLGESKWHKRPVGPEPVQNLIRQGEIVKQREGKYLKDLKLWLFAHSGITEKAKELIKKHKILWSDKNDLNNLLEIAGLRKLPDYS